MVSKSSVLDMEEFAQNPRTSAFLSILKCITFTYTNAIPIYLCIVSPKIYEADRKVSQEIMRTLKAVNQTATVAVSQQTEKLKRTTLSYSFLLFSFFQPSASIYIRVGCICSTFERVRSPYLIYLLCFTYKIFRQCGDFGCW